MTPSHATCPDPVLEQGQAATCPDPVGQAVTKIPWRLVLLRLPGSAPQLVLIELMGDAEDPTPSAAQHGRAW